MKPFDKELLNALIDRYERSRGFQENRKQNRRMILNLYGGPKNEFPAYDIEDNEARCAINEAAVRLANENLVTLEWLRGEENHILRRVALCDDKIEAAYRRASREPLARQTANLYTNLQAAAAQTAAPWASAYLDAELTFLQAHRRASAFFPAEPKEQREWFALLQEAAQPRPEPLLERVFSIRCFGDSKRFEKIYRTRLLRTLKKYLPMDTGEMNDEELLRQIGLEKYPELFSLCGDVSLHWPDGKSVELLPFADGAQISAKDAANVTFQLPTQVDTLLFIENKANYYDFIRNRKSSGEVAIYHGGCYSPQRGAFFKKLCAAAGPAVKILHWGDIDLGGFQMHARLKQEIDSRFGMYRMGCEELQSHLEQAKHFDEAYAKKIVPLLQNPYLQDAGDILKLMLEKNLRLEQEGQI